MGHRTVKRVPIGFDWPIGKTWKGYDCDVWVPCPENDKTCFAGATPGRKWLEAIVRILMCAGEDGKGKRHSGLWPHPYLTELPTAPYVGRDPRRIVPPTAELTQLTEGLGGRPTSIFGHDSIDNWSATKKIVEAAGLDPKSWGICPTCGGTAQDPATKEATEAWQPTEPPTGEGWQMWETVSEGSPMSPVFKTPEALADWCALHDPNMGGGPTLGRDRWLALILGENGGVEVGSMIVGIQGGPNHPGYFGSAAAAPKPEDS